MSTSPNKVLIDLSALKDNLEIIRGLLDTKTKIMGIVKSDAYGHGMIQVSKQLERHHIDSLGLDYLSEAVKLRNEGVKLPIVLLLGINTSEEARNVADYNLIPVIYNVDSARMLSGEGEKTGRAIKVFIKIDTGMGRLGINFRETGLFLNALKQMKGIAIEGLLSHLSSADEQDTTFTNAQIKSFNEAISAGRKLGFKLAMNSLANSAGIIRYKKAHCDIVRPGIILYGGLPCPDFTNPPPLRNVMTFCSRIMQVRDVEHGTPISYGRTFYAHDATKIAILSAGYADGLSRSLGNTGKVLIHGRMAPIIGRVCMNMTIADVSAISDVKKGDRVCFLGADKESAITSDDVARWSDTISYEILCSLGSRNDREYIE